MIPIETLLTFFMASAFLALIPGPDNIFVLTQSALNGKISGIFVTAGLCTGLLVHTAAVVFGVAVIFKTSAMAFTTLKLVGACYLLYLAWQAFRSQESVDKARTNGEQRLGKLYIRGIIMNITNPKVSIFFLAFLPQFADPARGSLAVQLVILGGVFILATILVFGSIALLAGILGQWFTQSLKARIVMNRMAGLVFVGLALKLATSNR